MLASLSNASLSNNTVSNILSRIPSHNYTLSISKYHVINTSSQNLFGNIAPGNAMSVLPLAFSILFPLLVVLILLFLLIGYVTDSKSIKETSSSYMKDLALIIILAGIVNAYGFNLFYNVLHIGYFFNQDFKMYNSLSTDFFSVWSLSVFTTSVIKGIEAQVVAWFTFPGVKELGGAAIAATTQVYATAITGILDTIITFSLDGFKITWIVLFLLSFAQVVSITYLLPVGIVFRAFQPTKTVGAGLIALALSLGFVFPIVTYVMTWVAFYIRNYVPIWTPLGTVTMYQISHLQFHLSTTSITSAFVHSLSYGGPLVVATASPIFLLIIFFKIMLEYVLFLFLMGTLIPGLSVLLTIISITGMTSYFGGAGMGLPKIKI